ncbi:MAG TPA: CehA/McbA family metallohydrolase [Ktedonobacterales bacterium]|jgi:hypothetical protein
MRNLPFRQPGRFYKGNLHTHSTRSDGALEPEAVIAAYREHDYDFIALTDHFLAAYDFPITDTRAFRNESFTTLLGAELHAPETEHGEFWHLLAVGLPLDFAPPKEDETGPALAARAAEAGAFVGIAHPAWYTLTLADAMSIEAAHAVETYNTNCEVDNDTGASWEIYEMLLAAGRRLNAYATDDAHLDPALPDAFGGWVQVRAEELTPVALLVALKAGHYYSSQGPEIYDLAIENGDAIIRCSPCSVVMLTGATYHVVRERGDGLTEVRLPLGQFHRSYARLTVIDAAGKRAWSNPFWLD